MSERENRVITTLDPAEYHGLERLSSGGVKQMLRSPAHYRQWKDTPTIPSPAMQFGSAVHCMVLEPHKVEQVIAVMPDDAPDKRSNSGKAWHAEFALNCAGKVVLSAEDNARADITNAMFAYAECVASDRWPSYAADIQEISLPPWARARTGNGTQPQEF